MVPAFVEARLPGEHLVWRDVLMEGPVSPAPGLADLAARAAYLARFLDIDQGEYRTVAESLLAGLAAAAGAWPSATSAATCWPGRATTSR